jgi:type I restriction enzyme S subunit
MLNSYSSYKNVTTFGVSSIPYHWNLMRGSSLFEENKEKNKNMKQSYLLQFNYGEIVPKKNQKIREDDVEIYKKYTCVYPGYIAINGLNLNYDFVSQRVGVVKNIGIITSAYISLKCRDESMLSYVFYLLKGYDSLKMFHGLGTGVRQTLSINTVMRLEFPVPPQIEQKQIVSFLDWKTSEFSTFIHEKKKEIQLLQEYKIAQINSLITRGMNLNENIKESGIDWIGEIPDNWTIDSIKQHFSIKKRIAGNEGYDVLSITQQGLKIRDISCNEGQMANSYANYQFVYPGEFAMNHMDLITGYIGLSDKFGVTSPDYRVFILTDKINCFASYYLRVFQICYKRHIFYKFGRGAAHQGRWRLPKDHFLGFRIPVPPYEEQEKIAKRCDEIERQIDSAIEGIQLEIKLTDELRIRMITDVVTGKMDVRNVAIPKI